MPRPGPLTVAAAATLAYLALIALAPFLYAGPAAPLEALLQPRLARAAALSVASAALASTIAVAATAPLALLAARRGGGVARLATGAAMLLLGMPPVGLGLSILLLLRLHPALQDLGEELRLTFSVRAVVLAQATAVAPLALAVQAAGYSMVPQGVYMLAEAIGARGPLGALRLYAPILAPAAAVAWLLGFLRALGEFGATLVLAGSTPWATETIPIAIYNMLSLARLEEAAGLLALSVTIGAVVVALVAVIEERLRLQAG